MQQHTCNYVASVGNLTDFPVVKEFWQSVKIWRSYRHFSIFIDCVQKTTENVLVW